MTAIPPNPMLLDQLTKTLIFVRRPNISAKNILKLDTAVVQVIKLQFNTSDFFTVYSTR